MGSNGQDDKNMPQIGQVIEHWSNKSWKVLRSIYSGPFSDVFYVRSNDDNHHYAMKCERLHGIQRAALKLDVLVLMALQGSKGFPRYVAAGRNDHYRYCVMQLVGPDLGKLRRSRAERRFSPPTALRILQQTLNRLEALHSAGWLCRDVKAPNFAIGLGTEESVVFMLDFGFARKERNGEIIPPREKAALVGTFQYCSVACHEHRDQSRRDDIESWFYMAIELLKGPLPWCNVNGHRDHKKIGEWKRLVRHELRDDFFSGLPKEFSEMLTSIDALQFYDRPQYEKLHELLELAAVKMGYGLNEPFDWEENKRMLRKAEKVGELGESHMASALLDNSIATDATPIDVM